MRIGINTRFLLKNRLEGIGRYSWETTKRIVLNHPNDEFFFFFDRPYNSDFVLADNVTPVVLFPQARLPLLWRIWFDWSLKRALKKYKIDVLYSPDGYLPLNTDVPSLIVSHDLAYCHYPEHISRSHLAYYREYFPKFHQKATHIVAVSNATKEDIKTQYGTEDEKISIGYNSCTDGFLPVLGEKKDLIRDQFAGGKPYFAYVGAIHPRKNIKNLIKAFNQYCTKKDDDYQLVLVGRWAWKTEDIRAAWESSPYKSRIHIHEYVADVSQVLAGAEALVYVSLFEGFGIPIVEAMHCDVPVITSNLSSMKEVADQAGLLVDPTSPKNIAEAMLKLSSDEAIRTELIQRGRTRRKDFSWQKTADHIYSKLEDMVG